MASRRDFLGSLALLGLSPYASAQTKPAARPTGKLPARVEFARLHERSRRAMSLAVIVGLLALFLS